MPDDTDVTFDVVMALRMLAEVLDRDEPLSALAAQGVAVVVRHLADQLDDVGGRMLDAELQAA